VESRGIVKKTTECAVTLSTARSTVGRKVSETESITLSGHFTSKIKAYLPNCVSILSKPHTVKIVELDGYGICERRSP